MSLALIIIVSVIVTAAVIVYFKWKFSYWKRRNVFTKPPLVPFGNTRDIILGKDSFWLFINELHKEIQDRNLKYGGFYVFTQPNFVVTDLELVRNILTTDFQYFTDHDSIANEKIDPLSGHLFSLKGAKWRSVRLKLTPFFTSGKLKTMFCTLLDCAKEIAPILDIYESRGECFDIKEFCARYTTDVVASIGYGIECNCLKYPDAEFRRYGKKIFDSSLLQNFKDTLGLSAPFILKFFKMSQIGKDVESFFLGIVKETVKYRDTMKIERNDFLQMLLALRNTEFKLENYHDDDKVQLNYYQYGLSLNEIAAQAFLFFAAGFETPSTTLSWLIYELAQHNEIQEKLRTEILGVLNKNHGEITYEAVKEMRYLDNCFNETLRKYPPLPSLPRECTKDYHIPGTETTIEKGTPTFISIYAIHHDPKIFPDPEKFDPDRFSDENKGKRSSMLFLPFGEGPRICIGLRLGVLQIKVGLIEMIRRYNFTLNSRTKRPMEFHHRQFILTAKEGIWIDVHKV